MSKILVGCDPEVFVAQKGQFKSAHNLIKGDKKNPFKVDKGAVQVDGMALEFNIDPAATCDEFVLNVNSVFAQLTKMVPKHKIVITPVAHFDADYMKAQPAEALELGCDPDFNAYTGAAFEKPDVDRPMRTASGHVHIGWTNGENIQDPAHMADAYMVAKQMDVFLGLGSLLYDDDVERRQMYGKAGCCRVKPYGVEYRTLSNAWLKSEKLMRWVFDNVQLGMTCLEAHGDYHMKRVGDVQKIINRSEKHQVIDLLRYLGIPLPV